MDKAIIFGAFEFIGYYLCKEFLEKGYEVTGILLDQSQENYIGEKRFEIGRNANFREKAIEEWEKSEYEDVTNSFIILPLYDLYMGEKEKLLTREALNKLLFQKVDNKNQIVCLLPIQLLNHSLESQVMNEMRDFAENIKKLGSPIQFFYLPSIFGPWQPAEFIFQKSLLNRLKNKEEQSETREWMMDAVFAEDAIKTMMEKVESECSGQFIIESGLSNQWEDCAQYLNIDGIFRQSGEVEKLSLDDQITHLMVKSITPISDSLTMQRNHLKYLQSL